MKPIERWVEQMEATLRPDRVVWCDGSEAESDRLLEDMLAGRHAPGRSTRGRRRARTCTAATPTDVARTEHLTFIASRTQEDAGPTNNWMSPEEAQERVVAALRRRDEGAHDVRGALRDGAARLALQQGRRRDHRQPLRRGQHADHDAHGPGRARAARRPRRLRAAACTRSATSRPTAASSSTFPRSDTIWSVGSGYGGNALLGKKCFALRIASDHGARPRAGWPSTC